MLIGEIESFQNFIKRTGLQYFDRIPLNDLNKWNALHFQSKFRRLNTYPTGSPTRELVRKHRELASLVESFDRNDIRIIWFDGSKKEKRRLNLIIGFRNEDDLRYFLLFSPEIDINNL